MNEFHPGKVWCDTSGNPIQAHGGGLLWNGDKYYWYGEHRGTSTVATADKPDGRTETIGVSCYSSDNLLDWFFEGIALTPKPHDPDSDLYIGNELERPKVIYNMSTGQFVMWFHIDKARNGRYVYARTGVATASSATGPFTFIRSFRPNGCESRDMTVFQDDDGSAYLVYSSEDNSTTHISKLFEDYLSVQDEYTRVFPGRYREAPAVCKHEGRYYLLTSGCTGWNPNEAEYAVADHPLGEWKVMGNPCTGTSEPIMTTFDSQSRGVLFIWATGGITKTLPIHDMYGSR
jgi:beta-xylosidase